MRSKEKGSALVYVLITLVAVSIIGASMLSVSLTDTKISVREENQMKAFYIARAAADSAVTWLEDDSTSTFVPASFGKANALEGSGDIDSYPFSVKVYRKSSASPNDIIVEATASVGTVQKTVGIEVKENGTFSNDALFKNAISAMSSITLGGSYTINGSIETPSINDIVTHGSGSVTEGHNTNPSMNYPLINFDLLLQGTTSLGNLTVSNSQNPSHIINSSGRYDSITVNGTSLTFQLSGGEMVIIANSINISNNTPVNIKGEGKLSLYIVGDSSSIDADFTGNVLSYDSSGTQITYTLPLPESPIPPKFNLFLNKGTKARLPGNAQFYGYIYGPESDIDVNGCDNMFGAIIGNVVGAGGGPVITYVPKPDDEEDPDDFQYLIRFTRVKWLDM